MSRPIRALILLCARLLVTVSLEEECLSSDGNHAQADEMSLLSLKAPDSTTAGTETEVRSLPGLSAMARAAAVSISSGYIPVNAPGEGARELFYVFVRSTGSPDADPLVLWTNGGPGCSGLSGFLAEMGPFRPTSDNSTLVLNPHTWTKFANMIFIEQPVGVGFSTIEDADAYNYNDANSAADMWTFVKKFVDRHPEFKSRPFYLTSQSYGGHFMPTTALHIAQHNKGEVNFKGFAVGNPLTSWSFRTRGQVEKMYGFGLIAKPDYTWFMENECYDVILVGSIDTSILLNCTTLYSEWTSLFEGSQVVYMGVDGPTNATMDPYGLGYQVCRGDERDEEDAPLMKSGGGNLTPAEATAKYSYRPCVFKHASRYLNRRDVQQALGVRGSPKWEKCPSIAYSMDDKIFVSMIPVYRKLIEIGGVRIMIYSGTMDSMCALQGLQDWIWDQGYNVTERWQRYLVDGDDGGFTTKFEAENGAGFRVTTVHGAGHAVAVTKPKQGAYILQKFLSGEWS